MTPPTAPVPATVEKWISRSKYLRWVDAVTAWLVLFGVAMTLLPEQSDRTIALISVALLVLGVMLRPLRVHWRPVSGWAGVLVSRTVRPGDRAWFVRDGRADSVLVTARRGLRVSIAVPGMGGRDDQRSSDAGLPHSRLVTCRSIEGRPGFAGEIEERPGSPRALRTLGGLGGHFGAPILLVVAAVLPNA